jgi:rRNA maturation protein Nop10
MKLIKVYVEDDLYERIKQKAGDVSLSKWMRITASNDLYWDPPRSAAEQKQFEDSMPKIGDTVTIRRPPRFVNKQKACSHGVLEGFHCWQCGGLAKAQLSHPCSFSPG